MVNKNRILLDLEEKEKGEKACELSHFHKATAVLPV